MGKQTFSGMDKQTGQISTADRTAEFIKSHPYIKSCLKNGLINYSSLARFIAKELGIQKSSSKEAILIAARRFKERLNLDLASEKRVKELLSNSEIELRNKIQVFILEKVVNIDAIEDAGKKIRKESGTFLLLDGSDNHTLITQEKYGDLITGVCRQKIIKKEKGLAMLLIKSNKEIEQTVGVISFITSLFAENGVNILELASCWADTILVIESKDIAKALEFLRF